MTCLSNYALSTYVKAEEIGFTLKFHEVEVAQMITRELFSPVSKSTDKNPLIRAGFKTPLAQGLRDRHHG